MTELNIGLLAHVDAGKTTLSEALLWTAGMLRRAGRVDHGDAFLDTETQEKERGITIFSKPARLTWKNQPITLVDTPGHTDFSGETERALWVLDCAVLVISGSEGVQGHTLTLWRLLESYRVPAVIFVNKCDMPGADKAAVLHQLQRQLSDGCQDLSTEEGLENAAGQSEMTMEQYLASGTVDDAALRQLVTERRLFPVCFGSALKGDGIPELLDTLLRLAPQPSYPADFGARIYKIGHDAQGTRLVFLKVTGGCLRAREELRDPAGEWVEKVNQLRLYSGARFTPVSEAGAGTICAVTGLSQVKAGDALGAELPAPTALLEPAFAYEVLTEDDPAEVLQQLRILEEEEPQLRVTWNERARRAGVQLMGDIQLEILHRLMLDRFHREISFGPGTILYKETIAAPSRGAGHFEPLRHYAEAHVLLEPLPRDSGIEVISAANSDFLASHWQRLIVQQLRQKRHIGVLTGSPLTDVRITLLAGKAHLKHTESGDFRQAACRAVRQALMKAQNVLLQPWFSLRLTLPADSLGRALNDLQQMGAELDPPMLHGEEAELTGRVAAKPSSLYGREVIAYTHGRGHLTLVPCGYEPCPQQEKAVALCGYEPERDTWNPADSVFCSHGSGTVIPWNESDPMMHIQLESERPQTVAAASAPRPERRREDEEELQAIFERTYGSVRKNAFRPTPRREDNTARREFLPPLEEYLLVDGYNIIFAWEELKELAHRDLASARQKLIDILSDYHGMHPCSLLLVYDSYKVSGARGTQEEEGGITVVYTKEGETADSFIEREVTRLAKQYRVRAATSDRCEQNIILGAGALRMSARELRGEVEAAKVEIRRIMERQSKRDGKASLGKALEKAVNKQR